MKISKIYLYDEPAVPEINLEYLSNFLKDNFHVDTEKRKNIFCNIQNSTAKDIASCRIFNSRRDFQKHSPSLEEISYEMENSVSEPNNNIVLYDGFEIQNVLANLISSDEIKDEQFHVIFTNKLTCTFDYSDYRYHGRALIASNPSIISTTGIIEAPAKPRKYYMELFSKFSQGVNLDTLKQRYSGTYLEYHDNRLSEIIEGYLMQAIFYYLTGNPFCENRECRLFNAHWQKDLLYSQLEIGKLCEKHQEIIKNL